jgi:hypothetical protein
MIAWHLETEISLTLTSLSWPLPILKVLFSSENPRTWIVLEVFFSKGRDIDKFVYDLSHFEQVRVSLFADFALKGLPVHAD